MQIGDMACLWILGFHLCDAHQCDMQEDPQKVKKLLNMSRDMFKRILETRDSGNVYAAHGLAAVLAEQATRRPQASADHLVHVKRIFDKASA